MKTKLYVIAGALVLLALCALGGNDLEGLNIGPFNLPPFFLISSFLAAAGASYLLTLLDSRLENYIRARRNIWRCVVVPTLGLGLILACFIGTFAIAIKLTAPAQNSEVFFRIIGL